MSDKLNNSKDILREYFAEKGDSGDQRTWRELKADQGIDPLTGFLNRKAFSEKSRQIIGRDRPFTLIMLDLDRFKNVNDTYGHSSGDAVLVDTAGLIRKHTREGDLICRWGGEEIIILLPDVVDEAESIAERFRYEFENNKVDFNGIEISRTGSFGVAVESGKDNIAKAIDTADMAMYQAKKTGRNKVVMAQSV